MQIDYDVIPELLLYSLGFFLMYYLCYRKYIYSILDPLFIYVFTISFSSVLIVYTLGDKPAYIAHFFLCHIAFFVGFAFTTYWSEINERQQEVSLQSPVNFYDYKTLRLLVYSLFFVYFLANVVLFYTTGFALLSDDPTIAKVENFTTGFGIIRKINFSVGSFVTTGILFLILIETKKTDIFLMLVVIILTGLEGSKSSLLRILIAFVLLSNHKFFRNKNSIVNKLNLIAPIGIVAMLGIFFTVLFKENTDSEQAVFAFLRRLLYGADSTLYFYLPVNEQYFAQFRFWQFPGHLFNQILGFLRLTTNNEAFGNVMVSNALPNLTGTIVGPNTPYYIEGQIFFGYYGAFIYSACVGGCYALIRQYFFVAKYYSAFWLVLICCICQQASGLNVEVTMAITMIFDTMFFVMPVYLFVNLAVHGKLQFRKFHF